MVTVNTNIPYFTNIHSASWKSVKYHITVAGLWYPLCSDPLRHIVMPICPILGFQSIISQRIDFERQIHNSNVLDSSDLGPIKSPQGQSIDKL